MVNETRTVTPMRRKRSTAAGLILGGVFVFLVAGVLIVFFMFAVSGVEFSPQTFERRRFSYYRVPWVHWQITGVSRKVIEETPVEEQLRTDKLITPQPKNQTWDCVVLNHGSGVSYGDARILTDYLDANGKGDVRVWLDWTSNHPECAKVFWPVVMQTAEEGMYLIMPELFTAARGGKEDEPEALKEKLQQIRVDGYRAAAEREEKLSHPGAAAEFYRRASNLAPNDAELQKAALRTADAAKTGDDDGR